MPAKIGKIPPFASIPIIPGAIFDSNFRVKTTPVKRRKATTMLTTLSGRKRMILAPRNEPIMDGKTSEGASLTFTALPFRYVIAEKSAKTVIKNFRVPILTFTGISKKVSPEKTSKLPPLIKDPI